MQDYVLLVQIIGNSPEHMLVQRLFRCSTTPFVQHMIQKSGAFPFGCQDLNIVHLVLSMTSNFNILAWASKWVAHGISLFYSSNTLELVTLCIRLWTNIFSLSLIFLRQNIPHLLTSCLLRYESCYWTSEYLDRGQNSMNIQRCLAILSLSYYLFSLIRLFMPTCWLKWEKFQIL